VEAFESFVAVALEADDFVVSGGVKFRVKLPTRKAAYTEEQTHGYEVDLVGARADRLVLASVKSAFGSRGVVAEHVTGETSNQAASRRYRLLNDKVVRSRVVAEAAKRYGYRINQVQLRLYVGRFSAARPARTSSEFVPGRQNNASGAARSRSSASTTLSESCARPLATRSTATARSWPR